MHNIKQAFFLLESVAHLQGREKELLPIIGLARKELEFLLSPPEAYRELLEDIDSLESIVKPEYVPELLSAIIELGDDPTNEDLSWRELRSFCEGFAAARR